MWVDDEFMKNSGSSAVPRVQPIVSIASTYDAASNRTGAFDARPKSVQPLSNMYAYDGLHRPCPTAESKVHTLVIQNG
jgi:hypothetical protein